MIAAPAQSPLFIDEIVLDFGGYVFAETVDTILSENAAAERTNDPRRIVFDFSKTTFIEAAALQVVIAAALRIKREGDAFGLRISESQAVRDFWRAWGFPKALTAALGTDSFVNMTSLGDRHYFGEDQKHYLPSSLPAHPGFPGDSIRSTNFFGFHSLMFEPDTHWSRLAYEEKDSWNASHIRVVLAGKLGRDSNYFPSRVVFEAVLNALRHPEATIMQTASTDQRTKKGRQFTVHFWDDGVSMSDTLRRAIERGTKVRGESEQDFARTYLLVESSDDDPESKRESVEVTDTVLQKGISSERALFATILPGVSSDAFGPELPVAEEVLHEDIRFGRRGMGLFVLINAVVEVLGGSVAFRTGHLFMNVRSTTPLERKQSGATLRVRIKRRPAALPGFLGNLITVRVPYESA